ACPHAGSDFVGGRAGSSGCDPAGAGRLAGDRTLSVPASRRNRETKPPLDRRRGVFVPEAGKPSYFPVFWGSGAGFSLDAEGRKSLFSGLCCACSSSSFRPRAAQFRVSAARKKSRFSAKDSER